MPVHASHALVPRSSYLAGSDDPMDVLKRRLAQGEITRQEYEELKQTFHA